MANESREAVTSRQDTLAETLMDYYAAQEQPNELAWDSISRGIRLDPEPLLLAVGVTERQELREAMSLLCAVADHLQAGERLERDIADLRHRLQHHLPTAADILGVMADDRK